MQEESQADLHSDQPPPTLTSTLRNGLCDHLLPGPNAAASRGLSGLESCSSLQQMPLLLTTVIASLLDTETQAQPLPTVSILSLLPRSLRPARVSAELGGLHAPASLALECFLHQASPTARHKGRGQGRFPEIVLLLHTGWL